jgi:hypothetical protein
MAQRPPDTIVAFFSGYASGFIALKPNMGMMQPIDARRFHAADLVTSPPKWSTFE